jgi:tetratricopeptide (TPR) repeat protein
MNWLDAHLNEVSIAQALSILRLTRWDPTAFLRLFPAIAPKARHAVGERYDLREAILKMTANRFPVTAQDQVLAFNAGVVLLELRFFAEAAELFRSSEKTLGRSAATSYNLGLCAQGLGRTEEALALMVDACNQDPSFEPGRNARAQLEGQRTQG